MMDILKACFVSSDLEDTEPYPRTQVTYNAVVADAVRVCPYGLDAAAPVEELAIALSPQGRQGTFYALPVGTVNRFKELKPGEVQVGNPVTTSSVKFDENGSIIVSTPSGDVEVSTGNGNLIVSITGDANITVNGTTSLTSTGNVDLTAPTVAITGDLTVTGSVTATGDVLGLGKSLGTHTHPYINVAVPSTTSPPN